MLAVSISTDLPAGDCLARCFAGLRDVWTVSPSEHDPFDVSGVGYSFIK